MRFTEPPSPLDMVDLGDGILKNAQDMPPRPHWSGDKKNKKKGTK